MKHHAKEVRRTSRVKILDYLFPSLEYSEFISSSSSKTNLRFWSLTTLLVGFKSAQTNISFKGLRCFSVYTHTYLYRKEIKLKISMYVSFNVILLWTYTLKGEYTYLLSYHYEYALHFHLF